MIKRAMGFTATIFSVFIFSLAVNAEPLDKALDRAEVLKAEGVSAAFVLLKAAPSWKSVDAAGKKSVAAKAKNLVDEYAAKVVADVYRASGTSKDTDLFLRLHAYDPDQNQKFIKDLLSPGALGRYFVLQDTRLGATKGLVYAPKFPDLLAQLKALKYEGQPPVFGIMVTVDKSREWWDLPEKERLEMMEEHTVQTLPFIKDVKRKLYHARGIGKNDFVTYFETADLKAFDGLIAVLKSVKEARYTVYGTPLIGRIATFDEALE
ncbi:MAG: chlorite dismutase family protein [Nitrospinae bacterium]|nr:chlorite dismutase family protein [Nitrospinota bacterium]